jgi:hypothetical protein
LRQRLIEWQRLPKSARPSLRALARELNTTHQLLSFYFIRLDRWRFAKGLEQFRTDAKAKGIRLTPAVEKRYLAWVRKVEERQARAAAKVAEWARRHPEVINWAKEMIGSSWSDFAGRK